MKRMEGSRSTVGWTSGSFMHKESFTIKEMMSMRKNDLRPQTDVDLTIDNRIKTNISICACIGAGHVRLHYSSCN